MNLEFPWMRLQLISCLQSLSNKDHQMECWVKHNCPSGSIDCFDISIHYLYDDTMLAENASSYIDQIFFDETEVEVIKQLIKALDAIFEKYGLKAKDEFYVSAPEWGEVLYAAKTALELLQKNDSDHSITYDCEDK